MSLQPLRYMLLHLNQLLPPRYDIFIYYSHQSEYFTLMKSHGKTRETPTYSVSKYDNLASWIKHILILLQIHNAILFLKVMLYFKMEK